MNTDSTSMFAGMTDAHIAHAVRSAEAHYRSIGSDPLTCDVALVVLRDCNAPEAGNPVSVSERERFEAWYVENAFDYESNPIGSRECALMWTSWQAARQPVGEVVAEATDAMVEAALQSTVSENAAPWRQIVDAEDHADFISDMRKAIGAALAALPSPLIAEATATSTQTVPDHCERIFWQSNYYQLPVGPSDLKKPTKRRQAAIELVQSLGYLWRDDAWTEPAAQRPAQVDLSALKHAAHEWANLSACAAAKRGGPWRAHKAAAASRDAAKKRFLTLIDSQGARP